MNNYFAAAYNSDAYGVCAYNQAGTCTGTVQNAQVPNTGILLQPVVLGPLIIGIALLFATAMYIVKKRRRTTAI